MIGQTLGSYSIQRELGRGGMGAVYIGVHGLLGRTAAVKVLLPELSRNQEIVQRFFNEARAATAIRHPGIVEIYDFGFAADGSAFIVMEFLDGESLSTRLRRLGRLAPSLALGICRQVALALHAAHKIGIVHRDLKPDNVFLVPDVETAIGERVKLLDFGIAKLAGDAGASASGMARTSTGAIMGTPYYMSPEQCRGAGQVDHRSDLYALGCMLYEMVAGRVPFVGEGAGEIIAAHIHVPVSSPRELAPDLPADVEALILRLLAKKADERPASAEALAQELDRMLARMGLATSSPGAPSPHVSAPHAAMPTPMPSNVPTTLHTASGQAATTPPAQPAKKSRAGLFVGLGVLVAAGAAAAIVLASSSGGDGGPEAAARTREVDAGGKPASAPDAAPAPDQTAVKLGFAPPPEKVSGVEALQQLVAHQTTAALTSDQAIVLVEQGADYEVEVAWTASTVKKTASQWETLCVVHAVIRGAASGQEIKRNSSQRADGKAADATQQRCVEEAVKGLGAQLSPALAEASSLGGDLARLLADARAAVTAEDWDVAGREARAALALDGGNDEAQQLADLAEVEAAAEVSAELVAKAAAQGDVAAAVAAYAQIPATSIYKARREPTIDELARGYLAEVTPKVEKAIKSKDCKDADKLADAAVKLFPEQAAGLAKKAKGCKPDVARPDPTTGPQPQPEPKPGEDKQLVADAAAALKAGQYGKALNLCQAALKIAPSNQKAVITCAIAACNLKKPKVARRFISKLGAHEQGLVRQVCLRNNVELDAPDDAPYGGGAAY